MLIEADQRLPRVSLRPGPFCPICADDVQLPRKSLRSNGRTWLNWLSDAILKALCRLSRTVASNAIPLRNLFPPDRAERLLNTYTMACSQVMELEIGYVEQAFKEYRERLDDDLEAAVQSEGKGLNSFGTGDVLCGRIGLGLGETFPEYKPTAVQIS